MNDAAELFSAAMQKLGLDAPKPRIAVAVSGGGDSLALTLLMHKWAGERGGEIYALTVDHGLRPGSRTEAEALHEVLKKRRIRHDILTWEGDKPLTHIQERAREARYRLLLDACRREKIPVLAVAHNLEDQIETFWMRLSKGSGLDGLTAMAPSRMIGDVRLVRPLLSFSRADLRQVCSDSGVEWLEDPSNVNEQFLRVKLRQFEDLLSAEGLTPLRLAQTLQKLEEARDALQTVAEDAMAKMVTFHPAGFGTLAVAPWVKLPAEIQRRVLSSSLLAVAPRDYAAGFDALDQLRFDILPGNFSGRTLGGCEIFPGKKDELVICREAASVEGPVPLENELLWDGRFRVSGYRRESPGTTGLEIGILGEEGLSLLRQKSGPESPVVALAESLPFKVKKGLPALWKGQNLMAVPHLNWRDPSLEAAGAAVDVVFVPGGRQSSAAPVKIV